jgi:hypothetical protein
MTDPYPGDYANPHAWAIDASLSSMRFHLTLLSPDYRSDEHQRRGVEACLKILNDFKARALDLEQSRAATPATPE